MRVAIVGSGVSGNVCAWLLHADHEVHLFESEEDPGGHTRTVDFEIDGRSYAADIGFMVCNDRTYPLFLQLLSQLQIPTQVSDMSFSVRCNRSGLEYQGSSLNGLFAQRRNLLRPRFLGMLREILRFNRECPRFLDERDDRLTLAEYLHRERYGDEFVQHYLVPMTAAIWSARPGRVLEMPARFLIAFFQNHGLLQLRDRPQWRTIPGGARRYVKAITRKLGDRLHVRNPIQSVERQEDQVLVTPTHGSPTSFDCVILACHADQSLRLLADATEQERDLLARFPYQSNQAILHVDSSVLPRRRRAWASWNYHIPDAEDQPVAVTYDLNRLQRLGAPHPICLTLNGGPSVDPDRILQVFEFEHPTFGPGTIQAQESYEQINGVRRTYFCGAYWGYGFHEDGVRSALAVCRHFGKTIDPCTVVSTTDPSDTDVSSR